MTAFPILYSFRRCPYAMRARLALAVGNQRCELREVVLRDKPAALLAASSRGTVPVLIDGGQIIGESLDIMVWALRRADPANWLLPDEGDLAQMMALIARCDGEFKSNLDRYKYPQRYAGAVREAHRDAGAIYLRELDTRLIGRDHLSGMRASLADMAVLPFVRQFASTDRSWFATQPWPELQRWLQRFVESTLYERVMVRYAQWRPGDTAIMFPDAESC